MRWFSSDLHLGHKNIIDFCDRPFGDVSEMREEILRIFNILMSEKDELYLLGDVAMGNIRWSLNDLSRIRPKVTLILGNHDRCHPMHGEKGEKWVEEYKEIAGIVDIRTDMMMDIGGTEVMLCHFPYIPDVRDKDRELKFAEWRPVDNGGWLLCGHVHNAWLQKGRMINVGVDAFGGWPVPEDIIAEMISDGPQDLDILEWF